MATSKQSILERFNISAEDLTEIVDANPSMRGMLFGYVAEKKFHDLYLSHPDVSEVDKDDDHDRKRKGDRRIVYRGKTVVIEVKSLQTNLIKDLGNDKCTGKSQVDASDSRTVVFPNKSKLKTTCLLRNQFDLLTVNCFGFGNQWRFAFALNSDLPPNTYHGYTKYQQRHLLPTLITVSWPLELPFVDSPFLLLDRLLGKG